SHGKNVITRGPFHQHAQGHVLRRKADPEGLAEDDKAGLIGRTAEQVERLERVFALCDTKAAGKTCAAIKCILDEGQADARAGIQRRPDIDRACGGKSESAGRSLKASPFL